MGAAMKLPMFARRLAIGGLTLALCAGAASPEAAFPESDQPAFASRWAIGMKSKSRLIAAGGGQRGRYLAGIQIELSERTVTYWRTPGDAGTPPVVSFDGSTNLAEARFEFPAPRRIMEDGIEALGYQDRVVFPLRITAADPAEPVTLRMKLDYAACEKICIPVHAEAGLLLSPGNGSSPFAPALAAAEAKVPLRQMRGQRAMPSIAAVGDLSGDWAAGKGHFVVEALVPVDVGPVSLFAEGPPGWYLQTAAAAAPPADGRLSIGVAIVQAPSGADIAKAAFVLTLVAGERAIEVPVRLDSKNGAL